ncbi:MAG TPA: hypothetical protein VMD30_14300 [Tepidisphaeraceae bacterium]|nr:hypothetical protein [Tepidisphaeraceae bacterium]
MGLDELKFWHWTLISLIMGPLFWYAFSGPVEPTSDQQTQERFEKQVLSVDGTQPMAYDITVYPAVDVTAGQQTTRKTMVVTYTGLVPIVGKPHSYDKQRLWFAAPIPYNPVPRPPTYNDGPILFPDVPKSQWPGIQGFYTPTDRNMRISDLVAKVYGGYSVDRVRAFRDANPGMNGHSGGHLGEVSFDPPTTLAQYYVHYPFRVGRPFVIPWDPAVNHTVLDYLSACKKVYPWVNYRFGWWKLPNVEKVIYIGGTFLIVGIIWPTFLWSLTTLGMGKPPKETYDLSRFGRGKPEPKKEAQPANVLTDDDKKRLEEMEATLTASLAGGLGQRQAEEEKKADAPVRKLSPGTADQPKVVETQAETKTYEGKFYPVAKGAVGANEEPGPLAGQKKGDKKQGS